MLRQRPAPPRFRRPRPRSGVGRWLGPVIVLALVVVWWFALRPAVSDQGWVRISQSVSVCGEGTRTPICVVDGDTLVVGSGPQRRRIRLTGFDAPELNGACPAEHQRALAARTALAQWLAQGPFEWDGAADPPRDQYGRELRSVRRTSRKGNAKALADTMIDRDLAAPSGWGTSPRDWCR